jgi:hypothetical protein
MLTSLKDNHKPSRRDRFADQGSSKLKMPSKHNVGRSFSVLSGNSGDCRMIQDFVSGDWGSRCETAFQAPGTVGGTKSAVGLAENNKNLLLRNEQIRFSRTKGLKVEKVSLTLYPKN